MDILEFAQQSEVRKAVDIEVMANKVNQLMIKAYVNCIRNQSPTYQMFVNLIKLSVGFSYPEKVKILNSVEVSNETLQIIEQGVNKHDDLLDQDSSRKGFTSNVGRKATLPLDIHIKTISLDPKFNPFSIKFFNLIEILINENNLTVTDARSKYLDAFEDVSVFPKNITPNTLCAVLYAVRPDVFPLINQYIAKQLKTLIGKFDPSPQGYIKAAQKLDEIKEKISPHASFGAIDRALSLSKELQATEDGYGSLDEIFKTILQRYNDVKEKFKFSGNNEIGELFKAAQSKFNESWEAYSGYKTDYSYGQGNWADVPWISICANTKAQEDQKLTSFTYLFSKDGNSVYLTLMAKSGDIESKFGKNNAEDESQKIATNIRRLCSDLPKLGFDLSGHIDLATTTQTGKRMESGVYVAKQYTVDDMPSEEEIFSDAHALFSIYDQYLQDNTEINTGDKGMVKVNQNEINSPLNQILYGPPGTGKTYATTELAVKIVDRKFYDEQLKINSDEERFQLIKEHYDKLVDEKRIVFTTFHQSFAYEDFIEGIRARTDESNGSLHYDVVDGIFKKLCIDAASSPNQPYLLIIDEINRGNISRIFGELITLLEPSKRKGEADARSVVLPYSKDKESFCVPNNVYVIGTMNTADKSLAPLDLALRRRFSFVETPPKPELLSNVNVHEVNMANLLNVINERIEAILDRDHLIGHAYFLDLIKSENKEYDLAQIFEQKIIPLLQEYFFDNWERIGWVLNDPEKNDESKFIKKAGNNMSNLFSKKIVEDLPEDRRYRVNQAAFMSPDSYKGIVTNFGND